MNDCNVIALAICAEALGTDSENYHWSKLKKDHAADFPISLKEATSINDEDDCACTFMK